MRQEIKRPVLDRGWVGSAKKMVEPPARPWVGGRTLRRTPIAPWSRNRATVGAPRFTHSHPQSPMVRVFDFVGKLNQTIKRLTAAFQGCRGPGGHRGLACASGPDFQNQRGL